MVRHEKSVRFRTQRTNLGTRIAHGACSVCSTSHSRGRIEHARTPVSTHLIWRLLRPRSSPLACLGATRARVSLGWGDSLCTQTTPCILVLCGTVTAPSACGHRSRVASRHMWGTHDGSGATRMGHGERGVAHSSGARAECLQGVGEPAHDCPGPHNAPWGRISNRLTAARLT